MLITPRNPAELRQGDIITDVVFPFAKFSAEARVASKYVSGSGSAVSVAPIYSGPPARPKISVEFEAVITAAAVMSQCCDVDISQDPPPPAFVLCRVIPPPAGVLRRPEWFDVLRSNSDPASSEGAFHGLFYLGELQGEHLVADLHQVMTVDWREYAAVVRKRSWQLDDVTRNKLRVRVGYHFGRPTEEDIRAGLEYPWDLPGDDQTPVSETT